MYLCNCVPDPIENNTHLILSHLRPKHTKKCELFQYDTLNTLHYMMHTTQKVETYTLQILSGGLAEELVKYSSALPSIYWVIKSQLGKKCTAYFIQYTQQCTLKAE